MAHLSSQLIFSVLTIVALSYFTQKTSAVVIKRSADKGNIYFETDEVVKVVNHKHPSIQQPDVSIRFVGPTTMTASTESPVK